MKLCIDCKHFRDSDGTCLGVLSYVDGRPVMMTAFEARNNDIRCGHDAHLFKEADGASERRIAKERADHKLGKSDNA